MPRPPFKKLPSTSYEFREFRKDLRYCLTRRKLPLEWMNLPWGLLKVRALEAAGYRVDPGLGVILGKRGRPLKPFQDTTGRGLPPLVDVRLPLPYPFHKTKLVIPKLIAYAVYGDIALDEKTTITFRDGDPNNTTVGNLRLCRPDITSIFGLDPAPEKRLAA